MMTLADAVKLLSRKEISPVELTETVLDRIDTINEKMRVFITVTRDEALQSARKAEYELASGHTRPLQGVPVSVKDLYDTQGIRTTAGAKVFADRMPEQDAVALKMLKDAGAVIVGKTNLHEFAYGVTTINPHYGTARNPWNPDRISGGSSGGSASAVALGLGFGSLGSDTGGSIRIPASLCGIVGLKPTYGRVSLRGVIPLSWSLDHAGPLARTVGDLALALSAIAGHDPLDPSSSETPSDDYAAGIEDGAKEVRVIVPTNHFFDVI